MDDDLTKVIKDRKPVSQQDHEMLHILKKYGKRLTKSNVEHLRIELKDFKSIDKYKPHYHKEFYQYLDDFDIMDDFK